MLYSVFRVICLAMVFVMATGVGVKRKSDTREIRNPFTTPFILIYNTCNLHETKFFTQPYTLVAYISNHSWRNSRPSIFTTSLIGLETFCFQCSINCLLKLRRVRLCNPLTVVELLTFDLSWSLYTLVGRVGTGSSLPLYSSSSPSPSHPESDLSAHFLKFILSRSFSDSHPLTLALTLPLPDSHSVILTSFLSLPFFSPHSSLLFFLPSVHSFPTFYDKPEYMQTCR